MALGFFAVFLPPKNM